MSAPDPCVHLTGEACQLGRRVPQECGTGCAAYEGLPVDERTPCEVWTRVMGYHRPVQAFNAGKQSEHSERRYFVERPGDLEPAP